MCHLLSSLIYSISISNISDEILIKASELFKEKWKDTNNEKVNSVIQYFDKEWLVNFIKLLKKYIYLFHLILKINKY